MPSGATTPGDTTRPGASVQVRDATPADAAACADVYAPYVRGTTVTFESEPPTAEQMAARVAAALEHHAWVVATLDGTVVGYAYAAPYAARPAYRWTCETSVYVAPDARGTGTGRALLTALLERLAARGFRQAVATYVEPNPASAALHAALGYEVVGTFRDVGFKHGAWRSVTKVQRPLGDGSSTPPA